MSSFSDKLLKTVVIEKNASTRSVMVDILKSAGFSNAQGVTCVNDAKAILETDGIDWIITPLNLDEPTSGVGLVRLGVEYPELRTLKASLLVEDTEMQFLSKSFELGLVSYFKKPITKESFSNQLTDFLKRFESNNQNEMIVSATYLYEHLKATKKFEDASDLIKNVMNYNPGNISLLTTFAESLQLCGKSDEAKGVLQKIILIDPASKDTVTALAKTLLGNEVDLNANVTSAGSDILGIKSVVIIDSDDVERTKMREVLTELGVASIQDFPDGEAAWQYIDQNEEPSIILTEWRIPKLTTPFLIQRIRSKGFVQVPIVVCSSLVKATDMPLIKEMSVAKIIQKPLEKADLQKNIIWTIQQDRLPMDQNTLEAKFFAAIQAKNKEEATTILARYVDSKTISIARKNALKAELALFEHQFLKAKKLAIESLKTSPDSVVTLNILGKALMALGDYKSAIKCFEKAQSFSPLNLERLCLIAESGAEVGEPEKADEAINHAKDLDPDSNTVQEGQVKVAIASGATSMAKGMMGKLDSLNKLISYLNNKAVAHTKTGKIEDGIGLYLKTLESVPDENLAIKARVVYNLALAQVRDGKNQEALDQLTAMIDYADEGIKTKAISLKERVSDAISNKVAVTLREGDHSSVATAEDSDADLTSGDALDTLLTLQAGDKCCYLIYETHNDVPEDVKKALTTPLNFKRRETIERTETLGGAGAKKAS